MNTVPRDTSNGRCPKCGGSRGDKRTGYCKTCHAPYMREWRKKRYPPLKKREEKAQ